MKKIFIIVCVVSLFPFFAGTIYAQCPENAFLSGLARIIIPDPQQGPPHGCRIELDYSALDTAGLSNPNAPDSGHYVQLQNIEESLVSSSDIVSYTWWWDYLGQHNRYDTTYVDVGTSGDPFAPIPHIYEDTGVYEIYMTLRNEQGCEHTVPVQVVKVGYPPLTDFVFIPDTACKDDIQIRAFAYDSLDEHGNLVARAWANEWFWSDDNGWPIGSPSDTTTLFPNEVGLAMVTLVSSHNGCSTEYQSRKEGIGMVCPPVAVIDDPKEDPPGQLPIYCKFSEIANSFKHKSNEQGAIYLRWYKGDSEVIGDTANQTKSPLMIYDKNTGTYSWDSTGWIKDTIVRVSKKGQTISEKRGIYQPGIITNTRTDGSYGFTYDTGSYLFANRGLVEITLWVANDSSVTDEEFIVTNIGNGIYDTAYNTPWFNECGYCEHTSTQKIYISHAKMNFTVSQSTICQRDSVVFFDSTDCNGGIFGWGFKCIYAAEPSRSDFSLGGMMPIKNYTPSPQYGNGATVKFRNTNSYKVVLIDTCGFGCIRTDTLAFDVNPRSIPAFTSGIGKKDTICANDGGALYLQDASYALPPFDNTTISEWEWRVGGISSTDKDLILQFPDAGSQDLYLKVTNNYGCTSDSLFHDQFLVNSITAAFTNPGIANGIGSIYNKESVSFKNTSSVSPVDYNRNTYLKYEWDWGDGNTSVYFAYAGAFADGNHTYDLPDSVSKVLVRLKVTIVNPVTREPKGCFAEYVDTVIVMPSITTYYDATICQGKPYSDDNFTNLTQAGIYYDTLQNINGGDSIVCLNLSVTNSVFTYYSAVIFQGTTYTDNNFTNLTQAGLYYDTLQAANGCDSIVGLSLRVERLNLDFRMGNFTNWQCYAGSCTNGIDSIGPCAPISGRHTIVNGAQLLATGQLYDERCQTIKKVPDRFAYAAKLGNEGAGAEIDGLEYTLTVDSSNSLLLVHFAWVMENPGHTPAEQPQFSITIRDSNNTPISNLPCGHVDFTASQSLTNLACTDSVLGRDWQTVGFSLEAYMGQSIKIYFETRDCAMSCHYSYAYIVAECRSMTINLMFCEGQTAVRFRAPDGFQRYTWTRSIGQPNLIMSGVGRQCQNMTLTDPFDGEIITCEVTSALEDSCTATCSTVIKKTSVDATFGYGIKENGEVNFGSHNNQNWYDTCSRTATFVDRSKVLNSKQANRSWLIHGLTNLAIPRDSMVTVTFPDPGEKGLDSVRYLVRLIAGAEDGCADSSKKLSGHYITIYASPKVSIASFSKGSSTYAKAIPVQGVFVNYTWSWEDANGMPRAVTGDSVQLQDTGIYMLVSEGKGGCIIEKNLFRVTSSYQISELYTMEGVVVSSDGYPLSGVDIYLSDSVSIFDSTTTDASGAFSFLVESNASVTLTAKLAGYTFMPEFITCDSIIGNLTGQNFTALLNTYTVNGQVTCNGSLLAGVTIYYAGDSTLTNGNGEYSIFVNHGDTVTLMPSLAGYTFTPASIMCNNVTANLSGQDFTATIAENPSTSISGKVFRQNQTPLDLGLVFLYQKQTLTQYDLVSTVSIENDGSYWFADVQPGDYIIKAIPTTSLNALPAYYGNTEIWDQATVLTVGNDIVEDIDITINALSPLNGNSFISGYVGEEGNATQSISHKSVTYPVEDACVYLQCWENSLWNTIAQTLSNVEGYFEFKNIPAGRYRLILDVPGLTIDNPAVMDINEGDTIQNIEYEITETGINDNTVDIASFVKDENLKIYPNPVQNTLHLQSSSTIEQVSIYDISGRVLRQIANPGREISVSGLVNGIYLIKVKTADGEVVRKIIKK